MRLKTCPIEVESSEGAFDTFEVCLILLFANLIAMDERRLQILVVISLFIVIKHIIVTLLAFQQIDYV